MFVLCFLLPLTGGTLNRDELVSLRDAIRSVLVEFHNVASIMDQVIQRNGGPAYPQTPAKSNRLSDHLDHASIEAYLRELRAPSIRANIERPVPDRIPSYPTPTGANPTTPNLPYSGMYLTSWIIWLTVVLLTLSFDCLISLVLRSCMRLVGSGTPAPIYPGRSRSPVRDPKAENSVSLLTLIVEDIKGDPKAHLSSILVGLSVQILMFAGNLVVHLLVYTCRSLGFLLLCLLVWDNMHYFTVKSLPPQ